MTHEGFLRVVQKLEARLKRTAQRLRVTGLSIEDAHAELVCRAWRISLKFDEEEVFLHYLSHRIQYMRIDIIRDTSGRQYRESPETAAARGSMRLATEDGLLNLVSDVEKADDVLYRRQLLEAVEAEFETLGAREQYVMHETYAGHRALLDIANEFGITEPRIHQIRVRAERKIRKRIERKWQKT